MLKHCVGSPRRVPAESEYPCAKCFNVKVVDGEVFGRHFFRAACAEIIRARSGSLVDFVPAACYHVSMESKLAFDYLQKAVDECMRRVRLEEEPAVLDELSDFYCYLVDLQFDLYRSTGGNVIEEEPRETGRIIRFPSERRRAEIRAEGKWAAFRAIF